LAVGLFLVATKYTYEQWVSNLEWAQCNVQALGFPSLADIGALGFLFGLEALNTLERDILSLLDYELRLNKEDLRDCLNDLSSHRHVEDLASLERPISHPRQSHTLEETIVNSHPIREEIAALKSGSLAPESPGQAPSTQHRLSLRWATTSTHPDTPSSELSDSEYLIEEGFTAEKKSEECAGLCTEHSPELDAGEVPTSSSDNHCTSEPVHDPTLKNSSAQIGVLPVAEDQFKAMMPPGLPVVDDHFAHRREGIIPPKMAHVSSDQPHGEMRVIRPRTLLAPVPDNQPRHMGWLSKMIARVKGRAKN
jgi:hypothetical protein